MYTIFGHITTNYFNNEGEMKHCKTFLVDILKNVSFFF